jgi:DNA-binding NtrC family response regulator
LELAPLTGRRVHVPALANALFERAMCAAGAASRAAAARLDDSALALLWRAPWRNGVHDLARLIVEIATGRPRSHYGGGDVERAAEALGIALLERFDSRRPARELLADALATTALPNGRANQRRAALYLGWDRDTLRLRLRDAGLLDAGLLDAGLADEVPSDGPPLEAQLGETGGRPTAPRHG